MMTIKNGFYAYIPSKDGAEQMSELSTPQVIEIDDGEVWLTACVESFDIDYVNALGTIGKMVMSEDGKVF